MVTSKVTALAAIALAVCFQAVDANFDLYQVQIGSGGIGSNTNGFQVYGDEANCDNALDWIWKEDDDVSSGYGIRCEGSGCRAGEGYDITEVEMNFRDVYHWSKQSSHSSAHSSGNETDWV
jgi:hypothetical protein